MYLHIIHKLGEIFIKTVRSQEVLDNDPPLQYIVQSHFVQKHHNTVDKLI